MRLQMAMHRRAGRCVDGPCVRGALGREEQTGGPATAIELNGGQIVTGKTSDLLGASAAALLNALKVLGGIQGIVQIQLTDKDVVRHRLVQQIVKAYERAAGAASRR